MLCIARALITNPEVCVLHTPTEGLDEVTAERILLLLRESVDEKGVGQDENTWHMRRPRTCIITAAKVASVAVAERVYSVSHKDGVKYISKAEAKQMVRDALHNTNAKK